MQRSIPDWGTMVQAPLHRRQVLMARQFSRPGNYRVVVSHERHLCCCLRCSSLLSSYLSIFFFVLSFHFLLFNHFFSSGDSIQVHCVALGESFPTSICLQKSASIKPRTSLSKFGRNFNSVFIRLLRCTNVSSSDSHSPIRS